MRAGQVLAEVATLGKTIGEQTEETSERPDHKAVPDVVRCTRTWWLVATFTYSHVSTDLPHCCEGVAHWYIDGPGLWCFLWCLVQWWDVVG